MSSLFLFRYGDKSSHPDDANRVSTRYETRQTAVQNRSRDRHYKSRSLAYDVMPKQKFTRGWTLSRSVLRERWNHPRGLYRTTVGDKYTFTNSVKEVLPGECVSEEDQFLDEFVHYTRMCGFMSFDTERKDPPVMVQVHFSSRLLFIFFPIQYSLKVCHLKKNGFVAVNRMGVYVVRGPQWV